MLGQRNDVLTFFKIPHCYFFSTASSSGLLILGRKTPNPRCRLEILWGSWCAPRDLLWTKTAIRYDALPPRWNVDLAPCKRTLVHALFRKRKRVALKSSDFSVDSACVFRWSSITVTTNHWQGPPAHGPTYLPRSYSILNKLFFSLLHDMLAYHNVISYKYCRELVIGA